jgi:serine/threonine protein kinase
MSPVIFLDWHTQPEGSSAQMVGKTVGKYRILDRIGRGGMGTVYRAVDETLDRDVAIKVLNPDLGDPEVLKRFRAEAVALARLNHPGIATIYELTRHEDDLLMVMEFVRGETLQELSERLGPLAPPQAGHLCLQILEALGHAHRAGVVHRDLKPANIMVTDGGLVKVMDFGIARVLGTEHVTHAGYMMGTPAYMAPEQVLGADVDGRADLYAVGVVFFRLLSRELPFTAETAIAMVQKQIGDMPTPIGTFRPDLPLWCGQVIERALAKQPAERYQSAEEFKAALLAAVRPEAVGEMPTMLTPAPPGLPISADLARTYDGQTRLTGSLTEDGDSDDTRLATPAPAVTAAPRPSVPERTTTTVVLTRSHLFTLAALMLVLTVGIAVLAYVALRQPTTVPAQPSAEVAGDLDTSLDTSSEATTGSPAPEEAFPQERADESEPPPQVPAVTPAAPAPPPAKPVAAAATRPVDPDTRTPPAAARAADGNGPAAEPPKNDGPAVATLATVMVKGVRVLVAGADGGETMREREVLLQLEPGRLSLVDAPDGTALASLPYADIVGAYYSRGNHPRWRDADGEEAGVRVNRGRLGFLRSERNWLVLTTRSGEPLIIRLDDNVTRTALSDFQDRARITVQR